MAELRCYLAGNLFTDLMLSVIKVIQNLRKGQRAIINSHQIQCSKPGAVSEFRVWFIAQSKRIVAPVEEVPTRAAFGR